MAIHPLTTEVHQALVNFIDEGRDCALIVVLHGSGSIPRQPGTKAIVDAEGSIWGTIGGGLLEAEARRLAVESIRAKRPVLFDFRFTGAGVQSGDPICGGHLRVLVDPTVADHRASYAQAAEALDQHRRGVLLTTVSGGEAPRVNVQWLPESDFSERTESHFAEPIAQAIHSTLDAEAPVFFADPQAATDGRTNLEGLAELLCPTPLLLIAGAGHVGQALARQAGLVGFRVVVHDDRPEFCEASLYPPDVITRCGDVAALFEEFPLTEDTYVAIVGRGHLVDIRALALCINKPVAYVGMMGSRRKVALVRRELLESGVASEAQLNRLHAPIGLDIAAKTVPEIAASITAQLIAVRRAGRRAGKKHSTGRKSRRREAR